MMESNKFLFKKPLLMVSIVAKWFECVISLFLNLLGVKVLNLNLLKVQQAIIKEFLWKPTEMERAIFFVVKKVDNRTTVDT